jgi:hypothetical protein
MDPLTAWKPVDAKTTKEYHGSCACGKVQLTIPRDVTIVMSGYCHCNSCRKMTSTPLHCDFIVPIPELPHFPKDTTDLLGYTKITEHGPKRFFCTICSTFLYSCAENEKIQFFFINHTPFHAYHDIPPTFHCNYEDKIMRIQDGLIKYKCFPPLQPGWPVDVLEE